MQALPVCGILAAQVIDRAADGAVRRAGASGRCVISGQVGGQLCAAGVGGEQAAAGGQGAGDAGCGIVG